MNVDGASLGLAVLAGMVLGALYVAALWVAVRRLVQARRPVLGLFAGAALRLGPLFGGFYLVMDGRSERLVACLVGFLVVRVAATRWAGAGAATGPGV